MHLRASHYEPFIFLCNILCSVLCTAIWVKGNYMIIIIPVISTVYISGCNLSCSAIMNEAFWFCCRRCRRFLVFQSFQENASAVFQRLSFFQSGIRTTTPAYFEILVDEIDIPNLTVRHTQRVSNVFQILA